MEEYLLKLRKKPVHVRRAILVFSTTAITAFIFIFWFYSWTSSIIAPNDAGNMATPSGAAPTSLLKDNWQNLRDTFSEGFAGIKGQIQF